MPRYHQLPALVLLLTSLLALYTCPHSKVEESFNLQASHDLYYHGLEPAWRSFFASGNSLISGGDGTCYAAEDRGNEICLSRDSLPYDHIRFPGVVPRTFLGAFILSYLLKFLTCTIPKRIFDLAVQPMLVQFLIRLELLLLNWFSNVRLARTVEHYFVKQSSQYEKNQRADKTKSKQNQAIHTFSQTTIGSYYLIITASQFHIPFYSSRLLPNTFALLFVTNAYADWFKGNYQRTAMHLVFTTAIFRCDMLLLMFAVGLSMLVRRQLTIFQALSIGVCTGIISLAVTVPLDSFLWGRLIWPEFEVWWFNTIENRSSEWGEMVWHWYFSRALPKGLMATAWLVPMAFLRVPEFVDSFASKKTKHDEKTLQSSFVDFSLIPFFVPILGFVVLYSFLPHKEIRFIFPALPMFNVCAAYGMSRLHNAAFPSIIFDSKKKQDRAQWFGAMYSCGIGAITLTMVASMAFLRLSMKNYPGGMALEHLRHHLVNTIPEGDEKHSKWNDVHVHVDVAAAMTGVSLFGQRHASRRSVCGQGHQYIEGPFSIDKSGYEEQNILTDHKAGTLAFTHLLTERSSVDGYHIVGMIKGNPRFDYRKLQITTEEAIFVFENDNWRTSV